MSMLCTRNRGADALIFTSSCILFHNIHVIFISKAPEFGLLILSAVGDKLLTALVIQWIPLLNHGKSHGCRTESFRIQPAVTHMCHCQMKAGKC